MALVHRANEIVSPVKRASDNLDEVLRAERNRNDTILRYNCGKRNRHKEPTPGPTGNSVETDDFLEEQDYEANKG